MSQLPPITVSTLDLERIEALLDRIPARDNAQLESLCAELARANVVEPQQVPPTVVTMNSTVRFLREDTGKEFEVTLCYPKDADGSPDKVSVLAPIGSALLGLSVGQHIQWPLPGGHIARVRVTDVTYQPEREGEYNR